MNITRNSSGKGHIIWGKTLQRQRTVQSKWLTHFLLLLVDSDRPTVSYCNICRKYSDFADQKSLMFIDEIVHRMDTYIPTTHLQSLKTPLKLNTWLVWWIAKVNQIELDWLIWEFFQHSLFSIKKQPAILLTAHSYLKFKFKFGQGCLC